jgi:hypothetical protein
MKDNAFVIINNFCQTNTISKVYERMLFHKYHEDLYVLIEDFIKTEKSEPSDDIVRGFKSTLCNEMTLRTNIRLAEDEIKNHTKKELKKFERKQTSSAFWFSTFSSVVASFIFSILLLLIFTVAHSQVKSWLNDLNSDNSSKTEKVETKTTNP